MEYIEVVEVEVQVLVQEQVYIEVDLVQELELDKVEELEQGMVEELVQVYTIIKEIEIKKSFIIIYILSNIIMISCDRIMKKPKTKMNLSLTCCGPCTGTGTGHG